MKLFYLFFFIPFFINGQTFVEQTDKQLHFAAGNIAGAAGYAWSYNKHQDKNRAMITGVCTAFAAGVLKEMYDASQGGYIDHADVLATTLGGITISLTVPLFTERKVYRQRKRRPKSKRKCYKRK